MEGFTPKRRYKLDATPTCFERLVFQGHLLINYPRGFEDLLSARGILFENLKPFLIEQSERLESHAKSMTERAGGPFE